MSTLSFPVRGYRSIRLGNSFPDDPASLGAGDWERFPAQYQFQRGEGSFSLVAPDDCFLYFTRKNGQYLLVLDLLVPGNWQSGYTDSREPMVNALAFRFDGVDDESVRRGITTRVIERNIALRTRLGERSAGGGITAVDDWLARHATAEAAANAFLRVWEAHTYSSRPMVRKGDAIHLFSGTEAELRTAAVHIPRDRGVPLANERWYWLDTINLFRRLTAMAVFVDSPISSTPVDGPLRVWFEYPSPPSDRVRYVEGSYPATQLFNPPADGREIPADILTLSSFEDERIDLTATASMNWSLQWTTDPERWRDGDTTSLGAGDTEFFDFTHIRYDFGSRTRPIFIRIRAANGSDSRSFVLRAYRNLIAVARIRANIVLQRRYELEEFIESGDNKYLLAITNKIELILAMVENSAGIEERRDLEDLLRETDGRPETDRRLAFTVPYGSRTHRLEQAVEGLLDVYNEQLMNQVMDHPSTGAVLALKRAHIALHSTETGEAGLRERTRGFVNSELIASGDATPVFTSRSFQLLWSRFRNLRETLATTLMDFSKADLYLGIINALNVHRLSAPGSPALTALEAVRDRFITEFGALEDIQIRTTDFELAPGIEVASFRFETRAADMSRIDSRRAGTIGRIVNTLNLIEDLYKTFVAGREYSNALGSDGPFNSIPELVSFVENAVTLTENTIGLYEQWEDRFHVLRPGRAAYAPPSGWTVASRGIGLISGIISFGQIMRDANQRHIQGDHVGAQWLGVAAAGATLSLGLSVAAAMAWNPPAAAAIAVGAVILELIGHVGAAAYGRTALQADLAHTIFGDDYDRLPGSDSDIRHDWHPAAGSNHLTLQMAHLNSYLYPIRSAAAAVDRSTVPHPTLTIRGNLTNAREGSFAMLQLWDTDWPELRLNYWFNIEFGTSRRTPEGIPYSALPQPDHTVQLEIYFQVRPGSRLEDVNMVALAVSLSDSPEAAIRASDPSLTHEQMAARLYQQYGFMSRTFLTIT